MAPKPTEIPVKKEPQEALRTTYIKLFYEMQFRATKNALINYNEADALSQRAELFSIVTNVLTGLSASGVLASLVQKGRALLGSKAGVAGILGLPVCGIAQLINNSTSEFLPSYTEQAKKHVNAAAGWKFVSEKARSTRLRMLADPQFDLEKSKNLYDELLVKREEVSKLVLISEKTSREFAHNTEQVFLAMKRRNEAFRAFAELDMKDNFAVSDVDSAEDIFS